MVDDKTVITAAHCVTSENGTLFDKSEFEVYLGRVNAFTEKSSPEHVAEIWVRPGYKVRGLLNDIALITLAKPIKFNQTVAPICLPFHVRNYTDLKAVGWGMTFEGSVQSNDLMEVDVNFIDSKLQPLIYSDIL